LRSARGLQASLHDLGLRRDIRALYGQRRRDDSSVLLPAQEFLRAVRVSLCLSKELISYHSRYKAFRRWQIARGGRGFLLGRLKPSKSMTGLGDRSVAGVGGAASSLGSRAGLLTLRRLCGCEFPLALNAFFFLRFLLLSASSALRFRAPFGGGLKVDEEEARLSLLSSLLPPALALDPSLVELTISD
jgi:hypothetical protein